MELLGNFRWWMASWQHGLRRGLGFCSYRLLFIPRCQSLYRNQLINPSGLFLPLFPPPLPPQSSWLSLSWCKGGLPTTEGKWSRPRPETEWEQGSAAGLERLAVGARARTRRSRWPRSGLHPGCLQVPAASSQPDHRPHLNRIDFLKAMSIRTKRRECLFTLPEKNYYYNRD